MEQETAVAVYVLREVELPPGSWGVGDEDGNATELLVRNTSKGGKLPKTTVYEDDYKPDVAHGLLTDKPFITGFTVRGGVQETYDYKFRRYDAVHKTVYVFLCTVHESTDTASDGYKWVPWSRCTSFLTYPRNHQHERIQNTVQTGLDAIEDPFHKGPEGPQTRKRRRSVNKDAIASQHRTLDEY